MGWWWVGGWGLGGWRAGRGAALPAVQLLWGCTLPQHSPAAPACALACCSGGMIFTFYKAQGISVGASMVEDDKLDMAKKAMELAKVRPAALCYAMLRCAVPR